MGRYDTLTSTVTFFLVLPILVLYYIVSTIQSTYYVYILYILRCTYTYLYFRILYVSCTYTLLIHNLFVTYTLRVHYFVLSRLMSDRVRPPCSKT